MAQTGAWSGRARGRVGVRARVGVGAVSLLALLAGACGTGGDGAITIEAGDAAATPAQQLARASEAATEAGSGRMRATADYHIEVDGQEIDATLEMEGAFTHGGLRASVSADMSELMDAFAEAAGPEAGEAPGSMVMRVIQDGTTMYLRYDVDVDVDVPGMNEWMSVDIAEAGIDASELGGGSGLGTGPTSYLETLRGAGTDVVEAGRTEIDGVPVTRYEGTSDPRVALERADPGRRAELESLFESTGMDTAMPFVAWVDDDGVLRRMQLTMEMRIDGMSMTTTVTSDYDDFGADITIDLPPADEVTEMPLFGELGSA